MIDGGTFGTGPLVVNGTFSFISGTLRITSGTLTIGSSGPLGGMVTLGAGRSLFVSNTTTVNTGSLLVLQDGGGFISGNVANNGEIVIDGVSATLQSPAVNNSGLLRGRGRVDARLNNQATGEVRAATGETLQFVDPGSSVNNGRINLLGGTIEFTQSALNNNASGQIVGSGSLIADSIHNDGTMAFSGPANVLGNVTNDDGVVISSGGGPTTFFNDVVNDGEIRTSPGSFTVFFGSLNGVGTFTNTGTVNVEGDLSPGASPAIVNFGGALVLGPTATTIMEIGGTIAGAQHDRIDVAGQLNFGGTLDVVLINSFTPAAGNSFDLFNWSTSSGAFSALNLPALEGGLMWNASQLATAGVLSVTMAGDYNANGTIDAADYIVWRKTLGQTGNGLAADGNGDNEIDADDYNVSRAISGKRPAAAHSRALPFRSRQASSCS